MRPNSVFSIFINRARAGEKIAIQGTGRQSRQFTHARDIARAFALGLESDVHGEAINIVSQEITSIRRLADVITARLPVPIEYTEGRAGEISPAVLSSDKALRLLGWKAEISLEDGLGEMMEKAVAAHQSHGAR